MRPPSHHRPGPRSSSRVLVTPCRQAGFWAVPAVRRGVSLRRVTRIRPGPLPRRRTYGDAGAAVRGGDGAWLAGGRVLARHRGGELLVGLLGATAWLARGPA